MCTEMVVVPTSDYYSLVINKYAASGDVIGLSRQTLHPSVTCLGIPGRLGDVFGSTDGKR